MLADQDDVFVSFVPAADAAGLVAAKLDFDLSERRVNTLGFQKPFRFPAVSMLFEGCRTFLVVLLKGLPAGFRRRAPAAPPRCQGVRWPRLGAFDAGTWAAMGVFLGEDPLFWMVGKTKGKPPSWASPV